MPPHCDSLDGPVVTAARQALDADDVTLVLPYVHEDGEAEVKDTFERVRPVRALGPEARETADRLFFETVVRVHRAGEGAPYTGLKPAGLSVGPAIPLAERAVEEGNPQHLVDFLSATLRDELAARLARVADLAQGRDRSVPDARAYVEAMLGFEVYSHHLYQAIHAGDGHGAGGHSHG